MVQVTPQEVPKRWRSTVDLFEIGFLYVFLPLVVSTMDRPPLYLGGKILLWMVAWFFLRKLADLPRPSQESLRPLSGALVAIATAAALSAGLAVSGLLTGREALYQVLRLAILVLPACALVFLYLPARLAGSEWIPAWLRPLLPAIAFGGLHLSSGLWQAPLLALAGGWAMARWRLPFWLAALGQWIAALAGARWLW